MSKRWNHKNLLSIINQPALMYTNKEEADSKQYTKTEAEREREREKKNK